MFTSFSVVSQRKIAEIPFQTLLQPIMLPGFQITATLSVCWSVFEAMLWLMEPNTDCSVSVMEMQSDFS